MFHDGSKKVANHGQVVEAATVTASTGDHP